MRVLVTMAVLVALVSACGAPPAAPTSSPSAARPSASTSTTAAQSRAVTVPTCGSVHLRLHVVRRDSTMSQPFADVAVTSHRRWTCELVGYPTLSNREGGLPLAVHYGIYEREDPAAHPVVLAPGRSAYFSVGTAAAYGPSRLDVTLGRVIVVLPGTQRVRTLRLGLSGQHPAGQAVIPVGITSLQSRRPPGRRRRQRRS